VKFNNLKFPFKEIMSFILQLFFFCVSSVSLINLLGTLISRDPQVFYLTCNQFHIAISYFNCMNQLKCGTHSTMTSVLHFMWYGTAGY
jgi:hypothetical protein